MDEAVEFLQAAETKLCEMEQESVRKEGLEEVTRVFRDLIAQTERGIEVTLLKDGGVV